jgi:hypothetical protein
MFWLIEPLLVMPTKEASAEGHKVKMSEPRFGWIKKIYKMNKKLLSQKTLNPQNFFASLRETSPILLIP